MINLKDRLSSMHINRNLLWSMLTIVLAALTIRLVISFSGGMSIEEYISSFISADPFFLMLSLVGMLGFIFFEGEAVLTISKSIGYPRKHSHGFLYAAADTYFSAITPSATGGQPASAFFMIRDAIPGATVTAILVFNLIMYSLAALVNGLVCIVVKPAFFLHFSTASKLLISVGLLVLIALSVLYFFILIRRELIPVITKKIVYFLHHIHLIRQPEKHIRHMIHVTEEYGKAVDLMTGQRSTILKAFLFNILQRFCQISITVSIYLALGGSPSHIADVYITQSMVVLGSNSVPIPGSMGVTDALMLDGLMNLMSRNEAFRLELLSRSISFYLCVLISGLIVLCCYIRMRVRQKQRYRN